VSLIESSAPGRFGVVGNPSDMYGGSVISCSTAERAYCTIDTAADRVSVSMGGEQQTLDSDDGLSLTGGSLDLPKAALIALGVDPSTVAPFRLEARTEIPRQSGLAGSTALFAAILGAVLEHLGRRSNRYATAEMVRAAEFDIMTTLCGFQDAYMVVFGGLQYMDFRTKRVRDNRAGSSPYATMEPLHEFVPAGIPVVVAFTGVMHHSGQTHASLYERYLAGDSDAISAAHEFASYARAGKRAILDEDWPALAGWMTKNQELIRAVQPQNPANEMLIEAALSAGALAAKLAGAGGGGSIVALTTDPDKVAHALSSAGAAQILRPLPSPGLTVRRVE